MHIDALMPTFTVTLMPDGRTADLSITCILNFFTPRTVTRGCIQEEARGGVRILPAAISRNRRCYKKARGRGYRVYAGSPTLSSHILAYACAANDVVHLNRLPRLVTQAISNQSRCSLLATLLSLRAIPVCTPLQPSSRAQKTH